jgi:hypothetical protein
MRLGELTYVELPSFGNRRTRTRPHGFGVSSNELDGNLFFFFVLSHMLILQTSTLIWTHPTISQLPYVLGLPRLPPTVTLFTNEIHGDLLLLNME